MRYHSLSANPDPLLQKRLETFEAEFQYPLGEKLKFTISHGEHYLNFYQAMGQVIAIVAENEQGVQGTLSASTRQLFNPLDKTGTEVVYVGDFRVAPSFQKGSVSYRLLKLLTEKVYKANLPIMSVVMDGTHVTPTQYTGRVGIPSLLPIHKIYLVQLNPTLSLVSNEVREISEEEGIGHYANLAKEHYFMPHALSLRAKNPWHWLGLHGKACGLFENTLSAKRLFLSNNREIKNAHLSYFAYDKVNHALELINHALHLCHEQQYQGLFLTLLREEYTALAPSLSSYHGYQVSSATVYGTDEFASKWVHVNSAEI